MQCENLLGVAPVSFVFLFFKNEYMVFRWGQSLGTNWGYKNGVQNYFLVTVLVSIMCNWVTSLSVQTIWVDLH